MTSVIPPAEHLALTGYILQQTGIVLDQGKDYLLKSRLAPLLERNGWRSYSQMLHVAQSDTSGHVKQLIIDAISTNETSFFRDSRPFDLLAHKLIPEHFEREAQGLNIWSCAASTGQEVYSIAIVLKEILHHLERYRINILGTDISDEALRVASAGSYTPFQLSRGLSAMRQAKFFTRRGELMQISDELRGLASFHKVNLLNPLPFHRTFDIVFCRNVAVYFGPDNRRTLFNVVADRLKANGVMIIGSTECLAGMNDRFVRRDHKGAVYYAKN